MVEEVHSTTAPPAPLVYMENIWKVFNGVPVLWGINLDLHPHEIHALLGGNGSGKSTTMKILSGVYQADEGRIYLQGTPVHIDSPATAHSLGIYMVPQEPHIFPHLSVEENLTTGLDIPRDLLRERIAQLAEEMEFNVPLHSPAETLSIANQQLLEIMRGLLRDARVLILDEPTSALTFREVEHLFEKMRALTARGIGLYFISHRLSEVLEISHRITVLRDGVIVLTESSSALTSSDLVQAMLPEANGTTTFHPAAPIPAAQATSVPREAPVLEVEDLRGEMFNRVSFQVYPGEIVGLAGLVGAGRTELAEAIVGIDEHAKGRVRVNGQDVPRRTPRACQDLGLVYVPEDRHAHGIFLDLPHLYTITAGILSQLGRFFLSKKKEEAVGQKYTQELQIKATSLYQLARTLSGGNQQKVVLAKALATKPRCIILDEPTRGVDARARLDVYHLIRTLKEQGVGILLISSELEEVVEFSDRILVMYQGTLIAEFSREEATLERVMTASFGIIGE